MRTLLLSALLLGCASTPSGPPQPLYPSTPQGKLPRGMRNCPSALAGATTRVIDTKDGVDLEITAPDPVVQRQIVELAIVHEHLGRPNPAEAAHNGLHGGPGTIGSCPVIHVGTTVTYRQLSDGAVIHIHVLSPEVIPEIQRAITDRVALLAARTAQTANDGTDR